MRVTWLLESFHTQVIHTAEFPTSTSSLCLETIVEARFYNEGPQSLAYASYFLEWIAILFPSESTNNPM
jgi:hypothetical protein